MKNERIKNRAVQIRLHVWNEQEYKVNYDKLFELIDIEYALLNLVYKKGEWQKWNGWKKDKFAHCCDNLPTDFKDNYDLFAKVFLDSDKNERLRQLVIEFSIKNKNNNF